MSQDYQSFIKSKICLASTDGFEVSDSEINPILKPHQKACVKWAIRGGRRALFASFGLGKTVTQLEIVRIVLKKLGGGRGLIVAPLGVRQEFKRDAKMLGIELHFVRRTEELACPYCSGVGEIPVLPGKTQKCYICDGVKQKSGIFITNYESVRDGKLNPELFDVVSLDEAACLRGFGGTKTFREFMAIFAGDRKTMNDRTLSKGVQYRFVATATPSPNDYIELLAYSAFLGIMDVSSAKTRFFKRDSTKADHLTIHPHKEQEFWLWVGSWALFLQKPSDLGFSDDGYALPEKKVFFHKINVDHSTALPDKHGQGKLFREATSGVVEAAREKRDTLADRIQAMQNIIAENPDDHFLIWHDLEAEREAIEKALPESVSVYGSQNLEEREQAIIDFSDGKFKYLAAKPVIAGSGCNFQRHCHKAIFLGIGYKFNDFIQAIHRIHRFLQKHPVEIHIIYAESEQIILETLLAKWERDTEQRQIMSEIIQKYGLSHEAMAKELTRAFGVERIEITGENHTIVNNDCVLEAKRMAENSVGLLVTSIPFSTQYEYSPNYCYDEITEILTKRGWLNFGEINLHDEVATVNQETLQLEWQHPTKIIWENYVGKMLHFTNRKNFDLMVTPNHRMFADNRIGNHISGRKNKSFKHILASDIYENFVPRKWRMINTVTPAENGDYPSKITIPTLPRSKKGPAPKLISDINVQDFMRLVGWYLSEGYCDSLESAHAGRISICQTEFNSDFREEIKQLFERIGLSYSIAERAIVAHNKSLAKFLIEEFGSGSYNLRIPRWIKDLHPELLCILRDTMMKGDGTKTGFAYTSFSEQLKNDFQEICFLTGWRASISGNVVGIGRKQIFPEIRRKPSQIEYDGMIGCVTVPNSTIVVRRNGVISISGNSDFGHTDNNEHFFRQMDFLTPELLRILQPGRIAAIHVKDRIVPGGMTGLGFQTVYPFHARCIEHYTSHGFAYMGMKTIVTDVVRENNQTYRLGWTEQCKDGTKMGCGMPEYLLLFRKPPTETINSYADKPVVKSKETYTRSRWQIDAHGFTRSSGNRLLSADDLKELPADIIFKMFREFSLSEVYDFEHHVKLGEALDLQGKLPMSFMLLQPQSWHPEVWTDITRMLTLNSNQYSKGKQMHICPLQFDIVDRAIEQFSMVGDVVFDPFSGLGTVPYRAILKKRKGYGIELNHQYFLDAAGYCRAAELERSVPTLFDMEIEETNLATV